MIEVIGICPVCGDSFTVSELHCSKCNSSLKSEFAIMTTPTPVLWALGAALVLLVLADLRRGPLLAAAVLTLAVLTGALLALSTPIERVGASPVVADVLGADLQRNQVLAGVRLGGKLGAALSLSARLCGAR